jgi:hypothetical protein
MVPAFLVPELTVVANGESPALDVSGISEPLLLTLGIEHVVEQESLLLGIHGSVDGTAWAPNSLVEFPQKFYRGLSAVVLDLAAHADVRFVRAQWKLNRWGRGDKTPEFRFYLFAEPISAELAPH